MVRTAAHRPVAVLDQDRRRHHRHFCQAPARRRSASRIGGIADLGRSRLGLAKEATTRLRHAKFNQEVAPEEIRRTLAQIIEPFLQLVERPLVLDPAQAHRHSGGRRQRQRQDHDHRQAREAVRDEGKSVVLAAGDTFRAAAVEQLKIWASAPGAGGGGTGRRRPCRAGVRGAGESAARRRRRAADRHRGPPPQQGRPDRPNCKESSACSRSSIDARRTRCCWCSTPRSAKPRSQQHPHLPRSDRHHRRS